MRVRAIHQHFRLDDRDDAVFLAERGIARQRMRIRVDGELRGNAFRDVDDRAPLGEAGAELVVLDQPLAQAIEPFGDRLAREAGERLRARIDLDAGDDAELRRGSPGTARRPSSSGGWSRRRG